MTRGAPDFKVVRERLRLVASFLAELRALPVASLEDFLADRRNAPAAESLLRRAIEALFDVARHVLAKVHGLGTLEYRQVAREAKAQGLVREDGLAGELIKIAGFRNRLVHHYEEVTPEELYRIVRYHLDDLEALAAELEESVTRIGADLGS